MGDKNPLSKIFKEKVGLFNSAEDLQRIANDVIRDYLKEHHDKQAIDDINEFIKERQDKGSKINYTVELDDKGNVFALRGREFNKIYAAEVDTFDSSRVVTVEIENAMRKIAGEDGKIDASEKKFIELVETLKESGKDVTVADVVKAHTIVSSDQSVTKSEQAMFEKLVGVNEDIGYSHIKELGRTLIYEKDAPETKQKINQNTGEIEYDSSKKPDLFDRYDDNTVGLMTPKGGGKGR